MKILYKIKVNTHDKKLRFNTRSDCHISNAQWGYHLGLGFTAMGLISFLESGHKTQNTSFQIIETLSVLC